MGKNRLKIALILGTRPEIIKLSPLIRKLRRERVRYFLVHTGQHYSYEMDRLFFEELELPAPKYLLSCRSEDGLHGDHTGRMMAAVETVLRAERPDVVLVQGDTNSVLAGALVGAKIPGVRIGHVEAGLRSYDRSMPEEINRMVADHVSEFLFAPTELSKRILRGEGIPARKIHVTGNTIVDAVIENLSIARRKARGPDVSTGGMGYFLTTLHRQENVDKKGRLSGILKALGLVSRRYGCPILFPIHPRTSDRIRRFRLEVPDGVRLKRPVGFLEFLLLEKGARLLLTDSGGVQEEGCILRVPCVTLRTTTERPETLEVGANVLAGYRPGGIVSCAEEMLARRADWPNPFGDGQASQRIFGVLKRYEGRDR